MSSQVAVYKALGGGWEIRCPGFHPGSLSTAPPVPVQSYDLMNRDGAEVEEFPPPLPEYLRIEQPHD